MIQDDIYSTPEVLRQTIARVEAKGSELKDVMAGPLVLLGSGSSHCIGISAASSYEALWGKPAQAILGSEYRARSNWTHLAISRTGKTTEVVEAMRRAREAGARVGVIVGDPDSPAIPFLLNVSALKASSSPPNRVKSRATQVTLVGHAVNR